MLRHNYENLEERKYDVLEQYTVLKPAEAMEILGIGKNSFYTLLNSGQLKGFRIGRSWRVTLNALEEFMLLHNY